MTTRLHPEGRAHPPGAPPPSPVQSSKSDVQGSAFAPIPPPSSILHPPSSSPLPFHPAPDESADAFAAFLAYLDIGQRRSFKQVAKATGHAFRTVQDWARRFHWTDRVRAWNAHLLQARLAVYTAAQADQAAAHSHRIAFFQAAEFAAADKLLRAAQNALDGLLQKTPADTPLAEIARALDVASKIGRLSLDLATAKQELSGPDGIPIQIQVQAALTKIYGQPLPGEVVDVEASSAVPGRASVPASPDSPAPEPPKQLPDESSSR